MKVNFYRFLSIFTKFSGFWEIFKNRDFLHFPTDRGWAYELGHIGGQKKGHFRRFREVLSIFFHFLWICRRKWEREIRDKISLMDDDEKK